MCKYICAIFTVLGNPVASLNAVDMSQSLHAMKARVKTLLWKARVVPNRHYLLLKTRAPMVEKKCGTPAVFQIILVRIT